MKCKVTNKSDSLDYGQFKPLLSSFMNFAVKRFGFKKPPSLFFVSDAENAKLPLGKTAHYDPSSYGVTIFTDGRHPKDILRSLSHELVHHKQNCEGQFGDMGEAGDGYAQTNPHLRQMEVEANRDGSMCLRDWEDTHKKQLQESSYYSRGDKKMKLFEWKNAELATLIKERFGIPEAKVEEGAGLNTGLSGVEGDDDDETYMGRVKTDAIEEDNTQEEAEDSLELEESLSSEIRVDDEGRVYDNSGSDNWVSIGTVGKKWREKWGQSYSGQEAWKIQNNFMAPKRKRGGRSADTRKERYQESRSVTKRQSSTIIEEEVRIRKTVREAIKKYMARK